MKPFSKVVDFHVHPIPRLITVNDLLREMDEAQVDLVILLALDVDPQILDQKWMKSQILQHLMRLFVVDASKVIEGMKNLLEVVKTDHDWIANLVKSHPDRFIGFGSVNLSKGDGYVERKLREIDNFNLAGVKLIPTLQFFNPEKSIKKMRRVFKFCEETERVVICHTGCDPYVWEYPDFSEDANPKYLERIVREFEEVPVILAHMGCYSARYPGIWMDEALKLGKKFKNIFFDVAAATYVLTDKALVDKLRNLVSFDRILFGSDYPVVQGASIRSTIKEVADSPYLTDEEKTMVLGLNALKILKR